MRVAIVSDIHGNRPAFEAVLADIAEGDCEEVWCLGDLVGYGAEPDGCVELAEEHCAICLAGNHDLAVTGEIDVRDFSAGARIAAEWTQEHARAETIEYLRGLSPLDETRQVGLFHASPRDPVWEYVLSPLQAELCLDTQRARVCLVGHSHVALTFSRIEPGSATGQTRRAGEEVDLLQGEWILNPGGVGQPRDGDPRAAWLELDLERCAAVWRRVAYDIQEAALAIRAAGLPESLAERLYHGQ